MPEDQVVKIPKDVDIEKFCIFSCGIATGFGTSVNVVNIREHHVVAVWGLGNVGLAAVLGAKQMNAREIIGLDTNESKFELALKFGCTRVINPEKQSQPIYELLNVILIIYLLHK
jgi:S-(hydroxymethyl)glutathione dehydrogenase / alcohol dehydrogenase